LLLIAVPGFSVHQAQGPEWDSVAVALKIGDVERVERGYRRR